MNAYYSILARLFLSLSYFFASKIQARKNDFQPLPVLKPILDIIPKKREVQPSIENPRREMWRRYLYG